MFNKSQEIQIEAQKSEMGLANAFRDGNEWAFSEVYRQQKQAVLSFLLPRVKNQETAHDLMQEVFFKVYRYCTSYRPDYPLAVWVRTIARNTLTDWFRSSRSQIFETAEKLASSRPDPENHLQRKFDRRHLRTLFKRLTQLQRRVVWMRLIQEHSYSEIACSLGMSLAAVKCLLYRAKRVLCSEQSLLT